jgi:hypothetical protein
VVARDDHVLTGDINFELRPPVASPEERASQYSLMAAGEITAD